MVILEASYETVFALAKKLKAYSDGEETVQPCLQKFAKCVGDKSTERKINEIVLSKQTVTRHKEELSNDIRATEGPCSCILFFSLAVDESADLCDAAQLTSFRRGIDDNLKSLKNLLTLNHEE